MMTVILRTGASYPAPWARGPKYQQGATVPLIPATNMPAEYGECYWIATPELENDCYGILLRPEDYEHTS